MTRRRPLLLLCCLLFALLAACGQKGELYLPDQAHVEKYSGR